MVRLITRQRGGLAAFKLTKLFGIDDFPAAKDSGKVLIIIIYCYLIIMKSFAHTVESRFYEPPRETKMHCSIEEGKRPLVRVIGRFEKSRFHCSKLKSGTVDLLFERKERTWENL